MKKIVFFLLLALTLSGNASAQKYDVNKNTHSHNDYVRFQPFYTAYANRFASMEIDVFLIDNELYVAHNKTDIDKRRTIESLYLDPLMKQIKLNDNKPYPDGSGLQLLIDMKTAGEPALKRLEEKLKPIRHYFDVKNNPHAVRLVITGSQPPPERFKEYDDVFFFDGRPSVKYTPDQMKRIGLYSASFRQYSRWNGLGRMIEKDNKNVQSLVDSIHTLGKKIRFWGNPDTKTCWQAFIKLGVDYLNTDSPQEMANFLNTYENNSYASNDRNTVYSPTYKSDGNSQKPKNVILLISDGAGFSEIWAAATANGGQLNVMNFRNVGYSGTTPADDYNTDSAAGASAMATGVKTNNRHIGMDEKGSEVPNIIETLSAKGIRSGIISNDQITGATPASFFAHQTERDLTKEIATDIVKSPAALIIGAYNKEFEHLKTSLKNAGFETGSGIEGLNYKAGKKVIRFENDRPADNFRLIESAFDKSVDFLSADNEKGFFLMIEGSKIDGGGHSNKIARCIEEYLSFDKVVGKALKFADKDGETLVVVTSDHETGGLILLDGNYKTGTVYGTFTTNDHTGLPVPLFGYGPGSADFRGFIQNSDIQKKIIHLLK